jgi:hypothetical protein
MKITSVRLRRVQGTMETEGPFCWVAIRSRMNACGTRCTA